MEYGPHLPPTFHQVNPENLKIEGEKKLRDAIEQIDRNSGKPCVVVNENGACLGVLTDGDIRRSILENRTLDSPLSSLVKSFVYVEEGATSIKVQKVAAEHQIDFIPSLSPEGKVISIWLSNPGGAERPRNTPVLVLAGGKGSRLLPLTSKVPKPLIKVGNATLLDWAIEECLANGFRNFYFSVNYLKDQVISHLDGRQNSDFSIHYVEEERPLGTAGPIGLLPKESEGTLLVVNADVLHNVDLGKMIDDHMNSKRDLTVGLRLHQATIPFGVVELDGEKIVDVTEKPTLSFPVNAGIYVLSQTVRDKVARGVPLDMPDLIRESISDGLNVGAFLAHEFWLDVGTHENLSLAKTEIRRWNP